MKTQTNQINHQITPNTNLTSGLCYTTDLSAYRSTLSFKFKLVLDYFFNTRRLHKQKFTYEYIVKCILEKYESSGIDISEKTVQRATDKFDEDGVIYKWQDQTNIHSANNFYLNPDLFYKASGFMYLENLKNPAKKRPSGNKLQLTNVQHIKSNINIKYFNIQEETVSGMKRTEKKHGGSNNSTLCQGMSGKRTLETSKKDLFFLKKKNGEREENFKKNYEFAFAFKKKYKQITWNSELTKEMILTFIPPKIAAIVEHVPINLHQAIRLLSFPINIILHVYSRNLTYQTGRFSLNVSCRADVLFKDLNLALNSSKLSKFDLKKYHRLLWIFAIKENEIVRREKIDKTKRATQKTQNDMLRKSTTAQYAAPKDKNPHYYNPYIRGYGYSNSQVGMLLNATNDKPVEQKITYESMLFKMMSDIKDAYQSRNYERIHSIFVSMGKIDPEYKLLKELKLYYLIKSSISHLIS